MRSGAHGLPALAKVMGGRGAIQFEPAAVILIVRLLRLCPISFFSGEKRRQAAGLPSLLFPGLAICLQLVVKRLQAYAQNLGGSSLIVVGSRERAEDHSALNFIER